MKRLEEEIVEAGEEVDAGREHPLARVSRVLRYIGAILLLGSAVAFSLQGWANWGSVLRHCAFVGFALSLSGMGILCGLVFKEDKGARTFLGVATAIIPALFAQLGAMLFAICHFTQNTFPDFLRYSAPSLPGFLLLTLFSSALSGLIAYTGFRVFLGARAKGLTIAYMLSNAMILLPLREEAGVALLAGSMLLALLYFDWKYAGACLEARTWEGRAARLMIWVPGAVLFLRSALLYSFGQFSMAVVLTGVAVVVLRSIMQSEKQEQLVFQRMLATLLFSAAWCYVVAGAIEQVKIAGTLSLFLPTLATIRQLEPLLYTLPLAGIAGLLSFVYRAYGKNYRSLAGAIASYGTFAYLLAQPSVVASFLCLAVGTLAIAAAFTLEERGPLYSGVASFVVGLIYQCSLAIELYSVSPWASLAVSGITLVSLAVYLERNASMLYTRASQFRARVEHWG